MRRIYKDFRKADQAELVPRGLMVYIMTSTKTPLMMQMKLEKSRKMPRHVTHYYVNHDTIYRAQNINRISSHRCQNKTSDALISYTVCHLTTDSLIEQQENLKVLFQQIAEDAKRLGIAVSPKTIFFEDDTINVAEMIECIEAELCCERGTMSHLCLPVQVGDVVRLKYAYKRWPNGNAVSETERAEDYKIIQKKATTAITAERLFLLDRIYHWVTEKDIKKATYH